jgi:hypothetical protein
MAEEEHLRKTGRYMPSHNDVEDFLDRVNKCHDKVKDIIDGKVDLEEFDKEEHRAWKMEQTKKEIIIREKREKELKGRKGKGHLGRYKLFCGFCHTEYLIDDIDECTHCKKDLITQEVSNISGMF